MVMDYVAKESYLSISLQNDEQRQTFLEELTPNLPQGCAVVAEDSGIDSNAESKTTWEMSLLA